MPAAGMLFGGARSTSEGLDRVLSIVLLVVCGVYLYFATGAVYGGSGAARVLRTIGLTVGAAVIVLGYRFVLLLITLYSS